ncbi:predicted protein [Nematostella vectensis]|uniref:Uncharacterized protein n=1 Tax=Nematostella vectensis TaxID=45351 RepID=A7S6D7_NEMVE|nr:predicted protein [Nematostella vectensis]|eukprot:XP_001632794.1 predicted protein [Nematostella vectensis]
MTFSNAIFKGPQAPQCLPALALYLQKQENLLQAVQNDLTTTKSELKTTKNDLATTKNDLRDTKKDLTTTTNDLATIKSALKTTKNDLATTMNALKTTQNDLAITKNDLANTKNNLATTKQDLTSTKHDLAATKTQLQQAIGKWPAGQYCILAKGPCPAGFTRSSGHMLAINMYSHTPTYIKTASFGDSKIACHGPCGRFTSGYITY